MDLFKNLTVLSLEQATTLPYLTWRLVHQGTTVIRLEHPVHGDPNRRIGDNVLGEDRMLSYFLAINSGKKAITLDLSKPEGQEILRKLIIELDVDIFTTNQLPRNYGKLGIDYEILKTVKKDIIWLGLTGFGPASNEAAYDPILQARGGLMELTGEKGGPPQVVGIPLADMGASEHAFGELMKALYKRAVTGEGSRIDVSMFQSTVSWCTVPITLTRSFGKRISRRGNTHEFFAPVSVYATKDGYIYLAIGNERQWNTLVSMAEFKHLAREQYQTNAGRIADVQELNREIEKVTKTKTTREWIDIFVRATIPVAKVNNIDEVTQDPHIRDVLIRSEDPVTGTRLTLSPPPVTTDYLRSVDFTLSFPPRFGGHNEEIYGGVLGYSAEQLRNLRERQII
ncbi:MAG: CoA transferase [Deltaproteobacteria bacterium]|nr:CoA transferase [Deltaproteobacteria bacterium]